MKIELHNRFETKAFLILATMLLSMNLFALQYQYVFADQGNHKLSGNENYNTCYPCNGSGTYFTPNNWFNWTSSGVVKTGTCTGCWSEQVQLYFPNGTGKAGIIYQEILFESTNGFGGCTYDYCNTYCIVDQYSHSGCIQGTEAILNHKKLDGSGWFLQFYASTNFGYIQHFWLEVFGPNGFTDLFEITDPNQAQIFQTQMNIVSYGNGYGNKANFTAGAGVLTYLNAGYHALYNYSYTAEDSDMKYGSLMGNGQTTFTQTFNHP